MEVVKSLLQGGFRWYLDQKLTLMVWGSVCVIVFFVVFVNRTSNEAIIVNLSSLNPDTRDAEVVALARAGRLSTILNSTEDPTKDATSWVNIKSATLRQSAADGLVHSLSKLTPNQAFAALYSLEPDAVTASDAVAGLTKLGSMNAQNLKTLSYGLGSGDPDVRAATVAALGRIGGSAVVALSTSQLTGDVAQQSAMATFAAVGTPAIPELTGLLRDSNNAKVLRESAAADIGTIGDPVGIAVLEKTASDASTNSEIRRVCLTSIATVVLTTVPPATVDRSAKKEDPTRAKLIAMAKTAGPTLIESVLNNADDNYARACECAALGRLSTPGAIHALILTLASFDLTLATAAESGIESAGPPAVPELDRSVRDQNPQVRVSSALALGVIGTDSALSGLVPALSDTSALVRRSAAIGLGRSNNPDAIPLLIDQLSDPDGRVAAETANSLHELGTPAVGMLIGVLGRNNPTNTSRFYASQALTSDGESAISGLVAASSKGSSTQKIWIAVTLGGMHDAKAIPALHVLADDSNARVKWAADQALEQYQGAG